jgi:hypothetical protein
MERVVLADGLVQVLDYWINHTLRIQALADSTEASKHLKHHGDVQPDLHGAPTASVVNPCSLY